MMNTRRSHSELTTARILSSTPRSARYTRTLAFRPLKAAAFLSLVVTAAFPLRSSAANGSRVQTLDRNGNAAVTTKERNAAALSGRKASVRVYRAERGV